MAYLVLSVKETPVPLKTCTIPVLYNKTDERVNSILSPNSFKDNY